MAKFCTNCGAAMEEEKKFCTACGSALSEASSPPPEAVAAPAEPAVTPAPEAAPPPPHPQPVYQAPPQPQPQPQTAYTEPVPAKGSKYAPITTWGYIGIFLLMCIPIVGLIFMIVWACGKCKKISKRNLSRAMLILTVVTLVISLIIGIAGKALFKNVSNAIEQESGINISEFADGGSNDDAANGSGGLGDLLGGLAGLTGEDGGGFDDLINGAIDANKEAEAANDGWPKSLRKYPGGTEKAVASYRTEISGTTLEEMMGWIDQLKKDGFAFQDFYDFGMTEEDMLSMNGWWAYDGKTYLSVSYYDGIVTVDHTKELPDLSSYFG